MFDPRPKELIIAEELLLIGKFEEPYKIIQYYEKKQGFTPEERLWTLLLRGRICTSGSQIKNAVEIL